MAWTWSGAPAAGFYPVGCVKMVIAGPGRRCWLRSRTGVGAAGRSVRTLGEHQAEAKLLVVEMPTAAIASGLCPRWCCEHWFIYNTSLGLVQGFKSVPSWRQTT